MALVIQSSYTLKDSMMHIIRTALTCNYDPVIKIWVNEPYSGREAEYFGPSSGICEA